MQRTNHPPTHHPDATTHTQQGSIMYHQPAQTRRESKCSQPMCRPQLLSRSIFCTDSQCMYVSYLCRWAWCYVCALTTLISPAQTVHCAVAWYYLTPPSSRMFAVIRLGQSANSDRVLGLDARFHALIAPLSYLHVCANLSLPVADFNACVNTCRAAPFRLVLAWLNSNTFNWARALQHALQFTGNQFQWETSCRGLNYDACKSKIKLRNY